MKMFTIETKSDKVCLQAVDKDHAFAQYFLDVVEAKVPLEKIGNLIMLSDGKEEYPFRTVPLLWKMNVLTTKNAVDNLVSILGIGRNEARKMLKEAGDKDARLVPIMDELKLKQEVKA